jgi:GT2 family glycosyltransferase
MRKNHHKKFNIEHYNKWKSHRNDILAKESYLTAENFFFTIAIIVEFDDDPECIFRTIKSITNQRYRNIEILIINGWHINFPSEIYSNCFAYRGLRSFSLNNKLDLFKENSQECIARGDFIFFVSPGTTWDTFAFALINYNLNLSSEIPYLIVCDSDELHEQTTFKNPIFATNGDEDLLISLLDKANTGFSNYFFKKNYTKSFLNAQQLYNHLKSEKINIKINYIHENIVHYPNDCLIEITNPKQLIDTKKLIGLRVSIIIPNKDNSKLLARCLAFLNHARDWDLELIIVDNASQEEVTWEYYEKLKKEFEAQIIIAPHKFNFSRMINMGVANSTGDVLLILNNDVEFTIEGQIDELILESIKPKIGVVGSLLLNQDQTINHAGVILKPLGNAGHVLRGASLVDEEVKKFISQKRYYMAVTGALMATRRDIFDSVNGMDEVNLEVEFNDIDFCLKVAELGLKIVCLPLNGVIHRESSTRCAIPIQQVIESRNKAKNLMLNRWSKYFTNDPYHHPHLIICESNKIMLNHVE